EELRHVDPERRLKVETEEAQEAPVVQLLEDDRFAPVSTDTAAPAPYRFPGRTLRWWSLAAVVALCLGLFLIHPVTTKGEEWQEYRTALGEQQSLMLKDGSVLELNTQSRVSVMLSEKARYVRLIAGEALVRVRHEDER